MPLVFFIISRGFRALTLDAPQREGCDSNCANNTPMCFVLILLCMFSLSSLSFEYDYLIFLLLSQNVFSFTDLHFKNLVSEYNRMTHVLHVLDTSCQGKRTSVVKESGPMGKTAVGGAKLISAYLPLHVLSQHTKPYNYFLVCFVTQNHRNTVVCTTRLL